MTSLTDFITVPFGNVILFSAGFLDFSKWINSDLLSSNCTAFVSAHKKAVSAADYNFKQFSAADFSVIYSATLSI